MALRTRLLLLWRPRSLALGRNREFCAAAVESELFDNKNVVMSLIDKGRLMKVRFQDQKEFQMFLERANAIGVAQPDEPEFITSRLCEMDPNRIHVLVDHKIVLKYSKKINMEKAEKGNCPTDFIKFMDKDYQTDDD